MRVSFKFAGINKVLWEHCYACLCTVYSSFELQWQSGQKGDHIALLV